MSSRFSLGPHVAAWIEGMCVHGPGDVLGMPVRLTDDEKRFLMRAYEVDAKGRRVVRRALRGLPKGSRKTEFAAWLALAELAGPVRFSHFENGRARGRQVVDPYVVAAASTYEQADMLMSAARSCVSEGPLKDFFSVFEREIQLKGQPGVLVRVPAVAGANDGLRPTFVVADEVHEWLGSKQRVHLVLENGLSKREGAWSLSITTAGNPKVDSVGLSLYEYGKRVASGEVDDPGFLMSWREPTVNLDNLYQDGELEKAVLAANPEPWKRTDDLMRRFREVPLHEFARYHLNMWVEPDEERWLPPGVWDGLASDRTVPDRSKVVLGFDGCLSDDTDVLTESGWQRISEYDMVSRIATRASNGAIEWRMPSRYIAMPFEGEMLHFSGLSFDQLVTPNHGMFLSGKRVEAQKVVEDWPSSKTFRPRWFTQTCAKRQDGPSPEFLTVPDLPSRGTGRPYKSIGAVPSRALMRLIGWYVSEGCLDRGSLYKGRSTPRGRVVIAQHRLHNPDHWQEIQDDVRAIGLAPTANDVRIAIQSRVLAEFMSQFGEGSRNKRIPRWVKELDASLIEELLTAYFDGDGSESNRVNKNWWGSRSAVTNSRRLADDIQELLLLCGYGSKVSGPNGIGCYQVSWVTQVDSALRRRPESVAYDGVVYCFEVPNHVFMVRRNGHASWTGNSYSGDSTALVACTVEEQPHLFVLGLWEHPGGNREWRVPIEEVDAAVRQAMVRFEVAELSADPPYWARQIEEWEHDYGAVVVRFETYVRKRMAAACAQFYQAVTNGDVTHDGSAALARHVDNAVLKESAQGAYITKESKSSPKKIDAAIAAVVAHNRAAWHYANPTKPIVAGVHFV